MTTTYLPVPARAAEPADLDAIVATLTSAFLEDPLWGPAYPDPQRRAAQAAVLWRLSARSALRYPWSRVTANAEAAALWIPPGGTELTPEEEDGLEELLAASAGPQAAEGILRIFDLLGAARPSEPHFYLTLLGTHEDHRGRGLGMGLLAENLARIDELGAATYLESSNPANDRRYASLGFAARSRITTPSGHVVTTMCRPAR